MVIAIPAKIGIRAGLSTGFGAFVALSIHVKWDWKKRRGSKL